MTRMVTNRSAANCPAARRPSGLVSVECINRLILTQIGYLGHFGPVTY